MTLVHRSTSTQLKSSVSPAVWRILTGTGVFLLIVLVATIGYVLSGWGWSDSVYHVIVTVFGVGYREIQPVNTLSLRLWTIGLIFFGYAAVIYTVGGFAQFLFDGELRQILGVRRMQKEIDQLDQHIVICGFGRMGSKLAEVLATRGKPLLVIDQNPARVVASRNCGCLAIEGNATEEQTLIAAGVERAAILTTVLSDDVANVFITITAHDLNPNLQILARAEQSSTIKKLRQVGAGKVILPASIGADRLANMILRPSAESLLQQAELAEGLNDDLASLGLRLDELEVQSGSPLIGGTIADLSIRGGSTFLIVAYRAVGGDVKLNPDARQPLKLGDCVIILAHEEDILQLCSRYALQSDLEHDDSEDLATAVVLTSGTAAP